MTDVFYIYVGNLHTKYVWGKNFFGIFLSSIWWKDSIENLQLIQHWTNSRTIDTINVKKTHLEESFEKLVEKQHLAVCIAIARGRLLFVLDVYKYIFDESFKWNAIRYLLSTRQQAKTFISHVSISIGFLLLSSSK